MCIIKNINFLRLKSKKKKIKGMIRSQFRYCALIYMFSSRKPSNLDNKVHERSLRIVSGDSNSKN